MVSLDLDGTLIDSPFPAVLRAVAADVAPDRPDDFRAEVGVRHRHLLAAGDVAAYDWSSIIADVARDFGAVHVPDVDEVTARVAPTETRLLSPDIPEVLDRLRRRGTRLVIVTNGYRRFQLPAIHAVGLDTAVDAMVTADDAGAAKPDPRIFALAYEGHPGPRVHIGDRVDHDVAGPELSGARSILITPQPEAPTETPRPDAVAPDILTAIALIDDVLTDPAPA